tara:strand:+ start:593 stop:1027 length:435 start_codon:yes stop_codon:yes gene_type:complete
MEQIEYIENNGEILCIIIRASYVHEGINFLTPNHFSQQLGYMQRPKNYKVKAHYHKLISRNITKTQEVLFIKFGKIRIDLYTMNRDYIESKILNSGDVALIANCGHGLLFLEKSEIIEVKQGPYIETEDKKNFPAISEEEIIIK